MASMALPKKIKMTDEVTEAARIVTEAFENGDIDIVVDTVPSKETVRDRDHFLTILPGSGDFREIKTSPRLHH